MTGRSLAVLGVLLVAQVAVGGTAASQGADITTDEAGDADDPDSVQVVFADGAGTADAAKANSASAKTTIQRDVGRRKPRSWARQP